jgi:hypothetical protein
MNNRHLVVWAFGVGLLGAATGLGACAPSVTVSRDDEPGGTGGTDPVVVGGSGASVNGPGGPSPGQGGSSGSGAVTGGQGGGAVLGERAGGGGIPPLGGAGDDDGTSGSAGAVTDPPEDCPCSRRPKSPASLYCPLGENGCSSTTIGPDGGDVERSGTTSTFGVPFRLHVPAHAFEHDIIVNLCELTTIPPDDLVDVSPIYQIVPDGLEFDPPAEITIPWTVPPGTVPDGLAIYSAPSPEGPWERHSESYTNAGFEQGLASRSGYFIVAYPKTGDLAACP